HVNRFQPAVADALRPLGDRATVWFGFESGSDAMLARLQKAHTAARALAVGRSALASGAKVGANLLLGVPGETSEDRAATRAFVAELVASGGPGQVLPNPNIFNPLPGTPLYAACLADGSIAGDDYRVWRDTDIEAAGRGPVAGVDYGAVIDDYRSYLDLAAHESGHHQPWANNPEA
ncbi:MAG TPA: hypothetical protein VGM93_02720, partial [Acidimicrobiales bacterium]